MRRIKSILIGTTCGVAAAFAFSAAPAKASVIYDNLVLSNDAIGYWKLDGNANDSSANNHHGTATNITWLSGGPDAGAPGAARGDLTSDIHVLSNPDFLPAGPMSVVAWVRQQSASQQNYATFVGIERRDGWQFRRNSGDNAFNLGLQDAHNSHIIHWDQSDAPELFVNEWMMLVGVYDHANEEIRMYRNGVREVTWSVNPGKEGANINPDAAGNLTMFAINDDALSDGSTNPNLIRRFEGDLSRVSLHGTALSDADVLAMYTAIPEPASLGLLGLAGLMMLRRRRTA